MTFNLLDAFKISLFYYNILRVFVHPPVDMVGIGGQSCFENLVILKMKMNKSPLKLGFVAFATSFALGLPDVPLVQAQPGGLLLLPKFGAPKSRVGGGVRGGLTLPQVGAPKARVGGGVRGGGESDAGEADANHLMSMPVVFVLTPESVGFTVSESPTLYYYVTDETSFEFEVTVNRDERTLVQMRRWEKMNAGIHSISMSDLGIKLEEDADYEWNVALIPNPLQGSLDITSTGGIRRIKAKEPMKDYNDYGKHGIWYDMLQDLTERISADPGNKMLLKERGDLFKQVGLPEVAELDYAAAKTKG